MKQKSIAGPMLVDGKQEVQRIETLERKAESQNIRIGAYYSKLKTNQKKRFESIASAISKKFKIFSRKNPLEILLVRQIALNTIRIEEAELAILDGGEEKFLAAVEKWLFLAQKERREAIATFFAITKREKNLGKNIDLGFLREELREEQDLPSSKELMDNPKSSDRRDYEDATRTDA